MASDPQKIRVILVEPNGHGGHAAFTDSLARVLRRRYRVAVVTRARAGVRWCVPTVRIQTSNRGVLYWKIFVCLLKLARDDDVIHFQSVSIAMAPIAVLLRLTKRGTRLADTVHNVEPHNTTIRQVLDCSLQRVMVRLGVIPDVFVLTDTSLGYGPRLTRLLGPRVRLVPHQLFGERQDARNCMVRRRQKNVRGQPLRVLFFGVVRRDKGLKEFLSAALSAGGLNIELCVVGSFPDYDPAELQEYAKGVTGLTVVPGFASDRAKSDAFEWCDFCLLPYLPSFKVGSGVLVDACEKATPVISVDGSSVAARVASEGCGVVLPSDKPGLWRMLLTAASAPAAYAGFLDGIDKMVLSAWVNDDMVAAAYNYGD